MQNIKNFWDKNNKLILTKYSFGTWWEKKSFFFEYGKYLNKNKSLNYFLKFNLKKKNLKKGKVNKNLFLSSNGELAVKNKKKFIKNIAKINLLKIESFTSIRQILNHLELKTILPQLYYKRMVTSNLNKSYFYFLKKNKIKKKFKKSLKKIFYINIGQIYKYNNKFYLKNSYYKWLQKEFNKKVKIKHVKIFLRSQNKINNLKKINNQNKWTNLNKIYPSITSKSILLWSKGYFGYYRSLIDNYNYLLIDNYLCSQYVNETLQNIYIINILIYLLFFSMNTIKVTNLNKINFVEDVNNKIIFY